MAPYVKFNVDPKESEMMREQLISNDIKDRERIQWMIFVREGENWKMLKYGKPSPRFFEEIISLCPKDEGRQIIFRSANDKTDVYIKYIPDDANIKEKTYYATASESLFEGKGGCKVRLEIRDKSELSFDNPILKPYIM